jgi:ribonuclease HI
MKTGAGAGLLFVSPLGEHMWYAVRLHFSASNNMAEYEALLCGLKIAIEIGIKRLDVQGGLATRDRPGHEKRELPRR